MPSSGTELLEALDDEGMLDDASELDVVDELWALLLDDLLPPPPPPQATRPRMLSVNRLSFNGWLTGVYLLLDVVIAVSLIFIQKHVGLLLLPLHGYPKIKLVRPTKFTRTGAGSVAPKLGRFFPEPAS